MDRETIINFIPKPTNNDVIIYDTTLKDLIDVDVFEEYKQLLPIFNLCCQQYKDYKGNIERYEKIINNVYLYKSNWGEEDYLYQLQNEKKTYTNLYGPVKKIESNIEMLQKKVKQIEDKIIIQTQKEEKEIQERKKNVDKRINQNMDKLMSLREVQSTLKIEQEKIIQQLKENEEDFLALQLIVEGIQKGECKCQYCGSKLSNISPNSHFYKKTLKKLDENKIQLEKLQEKKQKNEQELLSYNKTAKEVREEIKNDSNFKSEDFNFYRKKSVEVLKLEGKRDEMLNNISELENELKNHSETKSKQFLELKDKIEKYELSLENLYKMRDIKNKIKNEMEEFNKLKEEILEMKEKMEKYKKFISIFYKIYEQKAAFFCGKEFKFSFFEFEEYTFIEKFKIYYNSIEYENLNNYHKRKVNEILEEKFYY